MVMFASKFLCASRLSNCCLTTMVGVVVCVVSLRGFCFACQNFNKGFDAVLFLVVFETRPRPKVGRNCVGVTQPVLNYMTLAGLLLSM